MLLSHRCLVDNSIRRHTQIVKERGFDDGHHNKKKEVLLHFEF